MYGMIYIVHQFCPQIENLSPSIPKLAIHLESGGTHLFWGYNQQWDRLLHATASNDLLGCALDYKSKLSEPWGGIDSRVNVGSV